MRIYAVLLAGIIGFASSTACAEDFMLPKSFSVEQEELPSIEKTQDKPVNNSTEKTGSKNIIQKAGPTDISLTELINNFDYSYSKTFKSTITALLRFNIEPVCYDSSKGQIKAKLGTGKEIFIILLPSGENLTHVRITPADGRYSINRELVKDIFKNIERNLYSNVVK